MRTLCSDYVPYDENAAMQAFRVWLKSSDGPMHDLWDELGEFDIPLPVLRPPEVNFESLIGMALGRRFIWTRDGYLGLAPPEAREGAHVVLLEGGRVPYILRKIDDQSWKFVGECYIHGIMYGEAFDSQKCEDSILR